MSLEAIYRGRRARYVDDYAPEDENGYRGWIGAVLDYGDGLRFGVEFGDPDLIIDPDDSEWNAAAPMLDPLPGKIVTESDGTTWLVVDSPKEARNAYAKLARCQCKPSHLDPTVCPAYAPPE